MAEVKVYTIGRGKLFLKAPNSIAYEDFGNVTDFTISVKIDKLEHYSTASGIKVKDAEIVKQLDFNIKIEVDELRRSTLEKFILGQTTVSTISAGTVTDETINGVRQGFWYKLAHENIKTSPAPVVTNDALTPTTYTEGTDYIIDYQAGAIYIVPEGSIPDNTNLKVDYSYDTIQKAEIVGGAKYSIQGDIWFKGDPPVGKVLDVMGSVNLTPSGDLKLIGDDWLKAIFEGTFTSPPRFIDRGNR
ncbi:MAG: hypothetical protein QXH20_00495 [Candidatus Bathyarchaeia archaeon]